ncbi:MAG TPA: hypothetical protein VIT41_14035 [Microlunatus sp.]
MYPTSRLVMLAGSSAGSGKSTTMRAVAARLRGDGRDVLSITEDDAWGDRQLDGAPVDRSRALPLFVELLHEERDGGTSPAMVVKAFQLLMQEALDRSAIWLQDWTWPEMFSMLGWDRQLRLQTSMRLQEMSAPLLPVVVYLRLDPSHALRRALNERGTTWFNRYAQGRLEEPVTAELVSEVAAKSREAEPQRLADLAGWQVLFVDGTSTEADVADAVWRDARL